MKNLKVSMKLTVGFLLITVLAVIIGAVGFFSLTSAAENTALLAERTEIAIIAARMNRNVQAQRAAFRGAAVYDLMDMEAQRDSNLDDCETLEADYDAMRDQVAAMLITETGIRLMSGIDAAYQPFAAAREDFITDIVDPAISADEMIAQLDNVAATVAPLAESVAALVDFADTLTSQMAEDAAGTATTTTVIMISVLAGSVVIAVILTLYISSLISKPLAPLSAFMKHAGATGNTALKPEDERVLGEYGKAKDEIGATIAATASFLTRINDISAALETIADGDLTVRIAPLSGEDILGLSLNKMTDSLNDMFGNINSTAEQVSVGSGQIADGAQSLAAGSTEQAASIQELSSSIAEIANRTKSNAEMAGQAAKLAGVIKGDAEKGSRQMDDMMTAVKDIYDSSQDIEKVIKVIDDIAFQTNILALNASVEAARVGPQGKGFAVVAEEVRSLAAKSASAAKDTEGLIAASLVKAEAGVSIAQETAASLTEIVEGINESSELVARIAESSEEQSTAISQINVGIDQVAQVVQQNSATAQESAAASQEMSGQSAMLRDLIGQFKTRDMGGSLALPERNETTKLAPRNGGYSERQDMFGKY